MDRNRAEAGTLSGGLIRLMAAASGLAVANIYYNQPMLADMAQAAQVANQTRVLTLRPEARSRVNTVYMICYFGGGSAGSLIGSWAWSRWQWAGVCGAGMTLMLMAAAALLSRGPRPDLPPSPAENWPSLCKRFRRGCYVRGTR